MKALLVLLIAIPLAAQQPAAPQPSQQPAEAPKAEQPKAEEPKAEAPAEEQAPAAEQWLTGDIDFGYRWVSDIGGDVNTYRSVVDLGEGPKLRRVNLTLTEPNRRYFDRIDVLGNGWGGDPYNTARISARKNLYYDFLLDYRNIDYFNFLPSFADPLQPRGLFFTERAFDTRRRMIDTRLDLLPGRRIVPFLYYHRNSGLGTGRTVFVSQGDEFPVRTRLDDHANNLAGGVRLEFDRFHVTLEQGVIRYRDDQEVFETNRNLGNVLTPTLGQQLFLDNLVQSYGVQGDSMYSNGLVTANPFSWLDLYGSFRFSQPETDVIFEQRANGQFVRFAPVQFLTGQTELADSTARMPHTAGSFSAEIRPFRRLRLIEGWMTNRLHNASSLVLASQFLLGGGLTASDQTPLADRLEMNHNRQEFLALFDITPWLTVRGGHRYVWGDARVTPALITGDEGGLQAAELRRHAALAGLTYRLRQRLNVTVDYEGASGQESYFRTSLHDFQRARVMARYQVMPSLIVSGRFTVLSNENPQPTIGFDFLSRQNTFTVNWLPGGGQRVNILAEYSRSTLSSELTFLDPGTLQRELSRYDERAHTGVAMAEFGLPGSGVFQPRLSAGGSFYYETGTRPARYYQPMLRLSLPFHRKVRWETEWKWYGLTQPTYMYEGFRTHQLFTGFRLLM